MQTSSSSFTNDAKKLKELWNTNRGYILSLEYEAFFVVLFSNKIHSYLIWEIIQDWINYDRENRLTHFIKLFKKHLQLNCLSQHFVENNIFQSVIFKLLPIDFQNNLKNIVKTKTNYVFLAIDTFCGYIHWYDYQHNDWFPLLWPLCKLPVKQEYFSLELIVDDCSRLYAFGGTDADCNPTNQVWSCNLSVTLSKWKPKANMNQCRTNFSSVVLNNSIYVLGGESKKIYLNYHHSISSCERYDSQLNQWFTVADMNTARSCASAAVLDGCIYIAGGLYEGRRLAERYNPQTDTWSEVAPMTTARHHFTLTPFAGRLWAIGGRDEDFNFLSSCESYDPVTDTWQEEAPLTEERWEHAAFEFNGKLCVVGGFGGFSNENLTFAEEYLIDKTWTKSGQLQKYIDRPKLIILLVRAVDNENPEKFISDLFYEPYATRHKPDGHWVTIYLPSGRLVQKQKPTELFHETDTPTYVSQPLTSLSETLQKWKDSETNAINDIISSFVEKKIEEYINNNNNSNSSNSS